MTATQSDSTVAPGDPRQGDRNAALVVYLLYALAYVTAITMIPGVIVAYVKRGDATGTWLDSHFRWQIATFWWTLLWGIVGGLLCFVLVGFAVLGILWIWGLYRVIKGWLRLNDGRAVA